MIHEIIGKVSRELISQQATSSAGSFDLPFKFSIDRLSLAAFISCGFIGGLWRTIPLLLVTRWIAVLYTHTYISISWAFQLLKNISRFAQSGVSSNLCRMERFPQKVRRGMSWLCFPSAWPSSQSSHQYFAFIPHIQVGFCLIARSQNYTNLPDSWICGFLRAFCGFLRASCG